MNPAATATIRAARAAKAQRAANQPKPRTGRRTAQAIAALRNLRNDIAIGLPPAALLERIDDELFKLTKGKRQMTDNKELAAALRRSLKAAPPPKEEPEHAIGQMVAASKRKGGRRKAQRRGK